MTARLVAAALVGVVVAAVVAVIAGAVFDGMGSVGVIGFWGYVNAIPAALVAFSATFALLARRSPRRKTSLYGLAVALALPGGALLWWNIMWGFPSPLSPEGQWMWPLLAVTLSGALFALRGAQRRRGG